MATRNNRDGAAKLVHKRNVLTLGSLAQTLSGLADTARRKVTGRYHLAHHSSVWELEDAINPRVPFLGHAQGPRRNGPEEFFRLCGCLL